MKKRNNPPDEFVDSIFKTRWMIKREFERVTGEKISDRIADNVEETEREISDLEKHGYTFETGI
jgi:hypothetical protein